MRVAVLGDSMIEALQVSLDKTRPKDSTACLTRASPHRQVVPGQYEVLNFGVSNYGLGQYLLLWDGRSGRFRPDYVFF